jgi:hypothetical protein
MDDILAIAGIAATAGIVAGLAMGLRWILDDRGDTRTTDLPRDPIAHHWPAGVQEEEPFRWRVETLSYTRRGPVSNADRTTPRAPAPNLPRTALG